MMIPHDAKHAVISTMFIAFGLMALWIGRPRYASRIFVRWSMISGLIFGCGILAILAALIR